MKNSFSSVMIIDRVCSWMRDDRPCVYLYEQQNAFRRKRVWNERDNRAKEISYYFFWKYYWNSYDYQLLVSARACLIGLKVFLSLFFFCYFDILFFSLRHCPNSQAGIHCRQDICWLTFVSELRSLRDPACRVGWWKKKTCQMDEMSLNIHAWLTKDYAMLFFDSFWVAPCAYVVDSTFSSSKFVHFIVDFMPSTWKNVQQRMLYASDLLSVVLTHCVYTNVFSCYSISSIGAPSLLCPDRLQFIIPKARASPVNWAHSFSRLAGCYLQNMSILVSCCASGRMTTLFREARGQPDENYINQQ